MGANLGYYIIEFNNPNQPGEPVIWGVLGG
jgi:hypothetical protein